MCLAYSHPIEFHHCDKVKVGWFWLQHKNKSISFTCHFHGQSSAVVEVWPHTPCHCHGHNQPNILPIFKTIIHWHWCYHGIVAVVRNNYINICPSQEKCTDQQSHSNQLEGSKCFSEMLPSIYKGGRGVYGDWLCGSPERAPTLPMP